MKKIYVLLALILAITCGTVKAQITGGTKTIGSVGTYANFEAALIALNSSGISGNVIFEFLDDDITLIATSATTTIGKVGGIAGNNQYSVTFKSGHASGKTKINIPYVGGSGTPGTPSITITDMSNLYFENINFVRTSTATTQYKMIGITRSSTVPTNINFESCGFEFAGAATGNYAIYSYYNTATPNVIGNVNINNCSFKNAYYSIYLQGISTGLGQNITVTNNSFDLCSHGVYLTYVGNSLIKGNTFKNQPAGAFYNIYLNYSDGTEVSENYITKHKAHGIYATYSNNLLIDKNIIEDGENIAPTTYYPIYLNTACTSATITNNKINYSNISVGAGTMYGIYCLSSEGTEIKPSLIANNIISFTGSNIYATNYGIHIQGTATVGQRSAYYNVYNNTVNLQSSTKQTSSSALYVTPGSATTFIGINFKNNIFANNAGGYGVGLPTVTKANLYDYGNTFSNNIYWSNAVTNIMRLTSTNYTTATWTPTTFSDNDNSLFIDPLLLHNYEPSLAALDNLGIDVGTLTDINGVTRSATTPDIGAVEWTSASSDLTLKNITTCGNTLNVELHNIGNQRMENNNIVTIQYTINNSAVQTETFSALVRDGQYANVSLPVGTLFNLSAGYQSAKIWIASVSGGSFVNGNTTNDTIINTYITPILSGIYEVGVGRDFENLTEAIETITALGMCGNVEFVFTDNTYNEPVRTATLNFGAVATGIAGNYEGNYSIVFKAAAGATPIINSTNTIAWITVSGVKNVTFRGLSFTNTANTGAAIFHFAIPTSTGSKSANNWTFKRCNFTKGVATANTIGASILYAIASSKVSDFVVDSCDFNGGYCGIYIDGSAGITNVTVSNSTFENMRSSGYGIYILTGSVNTKIYKNKFGQSSVFAYGVSVVGANTQIYGNYMKSNTIYPIYVTGDNPIIENNIIEAQTGGTSYYSIYTTSAGVIIRNNNIDVCGMGIYSSGANAIIEQNTIKNVGTATGNYAINIAGSGVSVKNNTINKCGNGIYVSTTAANIKITGNTITTVAQYGIYVTGSATNALVDNNTITNDASVLPTLATAAGVFFYYNGAISPIITNNKIEYSNLTSVTTNISGVMLQGVSGVTGTPGAYGLLANNIISIKGTPASAAWIKGIYFFSYSTTTYSSFWNVLHNTVLLDCTGATYSNSAALHNSGGSAEATATASYLGTNKNIKNNIFINNSGGYHIRLNNVVGNYATWSVNNNIYYSNATNKVYIGSAQSEIATGSIIASTSDANSQIGIDPVLNTSYIPTISTLNDKGAAHSALTNLTTANAEVIKKDYTFEMRNLTTPDIGAIEWGNPTGPDISVIEMQSLCGDGLPQTIFVKIKNSGNVAETVNPSDLSYNINNASYTTATAAWAGVTLQPGDTSTWLQINATPINIYNNNDVYVKASVASDVNSSNNILMVKQLMPLSGSYWVGPGEFFITITAANEALLAQGICGNVTFNIKNNIPVQTTALTTGSTTATIAGSPQYSITFTSANPASPTTLEFSAIAKLWTINLVSNIHFDNLIFKYTGSGNANGQNSLSFEGTGICDNVSIINCRFERSTAITATTDVTVAYILSSTTTRIDNIIIDNNTFKEGYIGVYIQGAASVIAQNPRFTNNTIIDNSLHGIRMNYTKNALIEGNTITRTGTSANNPVVTVARALIYLTYSDNFNVVNNKIIIPVQPACTYLYGINLTSAGTTTGTSAGIIANNIIKMSGNFSATADGVIGINVDAATTGLKVLHNTVVLEQDYSIDRTTAFSAFKSLVTANPLIVENNIFATYYRQGNNVKNYGYALNATANPLARFNHNVYYSDNPKGYYATRELGDINAIKNEIHQGSDVASVIIDPKLLDNFRPNENRIDNIGIPYPELTKDIYGTVRSTTTPDAGAVEFDLPSLDIAVEDIKDLCHGDSDIVFSILNNGTTTINSFTINYRINGGTIKTKTFNNGDFTPITSENVSSYFTITESDVAAVPIATTYTLKIWTSAPNGGVDTQNYNDTLVKSTLRKLSGTYTIGTTNSGGARNFANFESAVNTITTNGMCGNVEFQVTNDLPAVATVHYLGNDKPKTLGIEGNELYSIKFTSDATVRTINSNPTASASNYFLTLRNVKNVTFERLKFNLSTNARYFNLTGTSGVLESTGLAGTGHTQNITFDNCAFTFTTAGANLRGIDAPAANYTKNLVVKNCNFGALATHIYIY